MVTWSRIQIPRVCASTVLVKIWLNIAPPPDSSSVVLVDWCKPWVGVGQKKPLLSLVIYGLYLPMEKFWEKFYYLNHVITPHRAIGLEADLYMCTCVHFIQIHQVNPIDRSESDTGLTHFWVCRHKWYRKPKRLLLVQPRHWQHTGPGFIKTQPRACCGTPWASPSPALYTNTLYGYQWLKDILSIIRPLGVVAACFQG